MEDDKQTNPEPNSPKPSGDGPLQPPQSASVPAQPSPQPTVTQQAQVVSSPTRPTPPNGANPNQVPNAAVPKPSRKKRLLVPLVAAFLLLVGAGAAAYNVVVLNDPDRVWADALQRTQDGVNTLIDTLEDEQAFSSGTTSGTISSSGLLVAEGQFSGSFSPNAAQYTANLNTTGVNVDAELRVLDVNEETQTGTAYLKLDGLDSVTPLLGFIQPELLPVIEQINGQWYEISGNDLGQLAPNVGSDDVTAVDEQALQTALNELGAILSNALFSSDPVTGVFEISEYVGREDFEGDDTFRYKISLNESATIELLNQLGAFFGSEQSEIIRQQTGITSEAFQESISELIDEVSGDELFSRTADVWVDARYKYIRNVRFITPNAEPGTTSYVDLGLDYEGGDEFPFSILIFSDSETDGGAIRLGLTYNTDSKEIQLNANVDILDVGGSGPLNVAASIVQTPSSEEVTVERPEGAVNITELIAVLSGANLGVPLLDGGTGDFDSEAFEFQFENTPLPLDDVEL